MRFGTLRQRIVLMKRSGTTRNSLHEEVPAYEVYHPGLSPLIVYENEQEQSFLPAEAEKTKNKTLGTSLFQSKYAYWAEVKPTTGREYQEMQKIRAETTYNVTIRYLPGITYDMFIVYNGKKLNIESVLDIDERHKTLNLVCSEVIR